MNHVIRPWENALFRRCRRAWDLAARERHNYEPVVPPQAFDLDEAVHDALDVYYFPGMWDWGRAIVRPLAVEAFRKSLRRQRAAYTRHRDLDATQEHDYQRSLELGVAMLERYFEWAAQVDQFTPMQVATQFDVTIPDPRRSEGGLVMRSGQGIWFRARIDLVVMDEHSRLWLVEHRMAEDGLGAHRLPEDGAAGHRPAEPPWSEVDRLLIDEQSLTRAWAWETHFLATIEGTIHNELRLELPAAPSPGIEVEALAGPSGPIRQQCSASFRRTQIPRSPDELAQRRIETALEVIDMTASDVRVYPNPAWEHCSSCAYRPPCMAQSAGGDPGPVLAAAYRKRTTEDFQPGRLGSVWGFVPPPPRLADFETRPGGLPVIGD